MNESVPPQKKYELAWGRMSQESEWVGISWIVSDVHKETESVITNLYDSEWIGNDQYEKAGVITSWYKRARISRSEEKSE